MIVGLDPGASGGIAMIDDRGGWIAGYRMPLVEMKNRKTIDFYELDHMMHEHYLHSVHQNSVMSVVLEYVTSFGQGKTSAFNFGRYVGALELFAQQWCEVPELVTPQVWKKAWGLGRDKREALNLASVKFPDAEVDWSVLANDGIAEAGLIALYSLRKKCTEQYDVSK